MNMPINTAAEFGGQSALGILVRQVRTKSGYDQKLHGNARQTGFSLMELLAVLTIVAILAVGSSLMLGNRQSGAVRSLLDELEGAITAAHQATISMGRDIALVSWGVWDRGNPTRIAFGDADLFREDGDSANFIAIANRVIKGSPPTYENPALDISIYSIQAQQSVSVPFHFSYKNSVYRRAGIVVTGNDGWEIAQGIENEDINSVVPFASAMRGVLDDANNLCKGGGTISKVEISGSTRRFNKTVYIKVVTINSKGVAMPHSPMGLIMLMENSASVFRFYNPGNESGDGKWRRI